MVVRGVLDHVVQQARRHGDVIEAHVGEDVGHLERVDQVGLAEWRTWPLCSIAENT